ncbi:MAG TPA: anti-sigma factor [Cyanobacteria bacterium UBA8803]|nr:anti-sigma factor [Cyanobacteria bacterium UBA9273]HBL59897.1 anti-sigma factor [Cyanobacteria bacterium UBA8803]
MVTENYCFCELAPLYALDLLSEVERSWVEQQIAECPDLAEELTAYQSEVTAIPYSVPALPMAADLKDRLFGQLGLDNPSSERCPDPIVESYRAVRLQDLDWIAHTTTGVAIAIVHRDEIKRELVGFLRAEPGVHYPFHRHAAIEEIFMLEGDLVIGDEVYGTGDYIRSQPGSSHAPYTTGGCCFFFHTSMDDEYPELNAMSSC